VWAPGEKAETFSPSQCPFQEAEKEIGVTQGGRGTIENPDKGTCTGMKEHHPLNQGLSVKAPGPISPATPRILLEMQIHKPHSRPTESDTQENGASHLCYQAYQMTRMCAAGSFVPPHYYITCTSKNKLNKSMSN
jgi:hypothetical protein